MNKPPDTYMELAQRWQEGRDYCIRLRHLLTKTAILAPHGGGIEPGTSEIAEALAGECYSFYCLEGLRDTGNWNMHLTSSNFDETLCLGLLSQSSRAVAIHGCQGHNPIIYVGGRDRPLKNRVVEALRQRGFTAQEDYSHHAGVDPRNLCNRTISGKGLQIELSLGIRRALFSGLRRAERAYTTSWFDPFIGALREALLEDT